MKKRLLSLLCLVPLLSSSSAWALFNAQVLTGKRTTDFKVPGSTAQSLEGTEMKAAVHLDPIPLVPVGFGLSVSQLRWDKPSDLFASIDGAEVNLEVEAWLPIGIAGLVPYGKFGYTLGGAYAAKFASIGGQQPTIAFKPSGTFVAVGLKYEFLMRLGVMVEYERGARKLTFDKLKDLGSASVSATDADVNSSSLLLGVQAGF